MSDQPESNVDGQDGHGPEQSGLKRTWFAPLIACVLAASLLVILLIPGVLRYQAAPTDDILLALEDSNRSLEDRVNRLAAVDLQSVCVYEGDLYPENAILNGTAPDPETRLDLLPHSATRTSPQEAALPPEAAESFDGSIDDLLKSATVLVINIDGTSLGNGTGFFVDSMHVATNAHVVGNATEVIVTNQLIARPLRATVVARSQIDENVPLPQRDFALLKLEAAVTEAIPLSFALASRTQDIYASGYPGFYLASEVAEYANAVVQNQPAEPPQGVVTNGIVTTIQTAQLADGPLEYIPHTAQLSPGNSGGPLIDACGRVVGINTFVRQSDRDDLILHGDFALAAASLAEFLRANGVTPSELSSSCEGATRRVAVEE